MRTVAYVVALILALQGLSFLFAKFTLGFRFAKYFLWPGILFHEFCHWIVCKLTLAPVSEFRFGWLEGHVTHGKSRLPVIGMTLIAMAPLIGGIGALYLLGWWLTGRPLTELTSPDSLIGIFSWSWQTALALYLLFVIGTTFTPSGQDFKNGIIGLIAYATASWFIPALEPFNAVLVTLLIPVAVLLAGGVAVAWMMRAMRH